MRVFWLLLFEKRFASVCKGGEFIHQHNKSSSTPKLSPFCISKFLGMINPKGTLVEIIMHHENEKNKEDDDPKMRSTLKDEEELKQQRASRTVHIKASMRKNSQF